ncbi:BCCT family transporter [Bacillus sp. PK3_68]|uniref:BCCT family transporter n=1 Tax=Bacillus sp. PK3_68 TaxID=2027408 RepID=UPI00217E27A3|nr:BCCT family transporter [Bacillus sp. PK3_68]
MYWGVLLSLISIVLLMSGSLNTIQTASIAAAFPFIIIMIIMCYTLFKALKGDDGHIDSQHKNKISEHSEKKEVM